MVVCRACFQVCVLKNLRSPLFSGSCPLCFLREGNVFPVPDTALGNRLPYCGILRISVAVCPMPHMARVDHPQLPSSRPRMGSCDSRF